MSGRLSLEEVLQLVQDGEDPPDDVSDDDEDLVGDFVSASGRPMLFSDALRDSDVRIHLSHVLGALCYFWTSLWLR